MPSGFCWLNNVHVGIGHASMSHGLTHAAIIDFDLHHGDGSQSLTWAHNSRIAALPKNTSTSKKSAIGYFSLHDINSYPCEMGDEDKVRNASLCIENAHGQSIWNVHLQAWKTEAEFWTLYEEKYLLILAKARAFLRSHSDKLRHGLAHPKPKAAIFVSAGFDASEWESPGMQRHQVNVPTSFYARFTRDIVLLAEEDMLGVDGRVISVLEGGYSDRALTSGVLSHISGLSALTDIKTVPTSTDGHDKVVEHEGETPNLRESSVPQPSIAQIDIVNKVDPAWWSSEKMEEIESLVNPAVPVIKKQRNESRPTYTSSTQSYTAKIVSPPSVRRSLSGSAPNSGPSLPFPPKESSPPLPLVNWAICVQELSKILIPSSRETRSCKAEDLNAEATRARRDRQSTIGLPSDDQSIDRKGMQLREKRNKVSSHAAQEREGKKLVSRENRRKTFADVKANDPMPPEINRETQTKRPIRRRSSAASSTHSHLVESGTIVATQPQSQKLPPPVRKAKTLANARSEPTRPEVFKEQRAHHDTTMVADATDVNPSVRRQIEHGRPPLSINNELKNQDVDLLSSDMKQMRIEIKKPPKSPKEACDVKQTQIKPVPRGRPTKARTSKASKTAPPATIKADPLAVMSLTKSEADGSLNPTQTLSFATSHEMHNTNLSRRTSAGTDNDSQPATSLSSAITPPSQPMASKEHSSMNATQDQYGPQEETLSLSSSIPTAPMTPVNVQRTKEDLPIFTSTSPIVFSAPVVPSSFNDRVMAAEEDHEAHALPKDHGSTTSALESSKKWDTSPRGDITQVGRVARPHCPSGTVASSDPRNSIWDIPDTPHKM